MSINVIQLIQSAFPDGVVRQLSARFGLPAEATGKVIAAAAPSLVAALMQKGATLDGARSLFATIMAPEVDAHIGEELPHLLASTAGLSQLEGAGRELLERVTERRIDAVSDMLAAQTGVPAQSTHALTGIVGATLFGILKRYFLNGQGGVGQLPTLLGHQLPNIAPYLNDGLLSALGLGGFATFVDTVPSQLKAVLAHIEHPVAPAAPATSSAHAAQAAPRVPVDAVLREERRSHKWLWWLLAVIAAVLVFLFLRGCEDEQSTGVAAPAAQGASEPAAVAASAPGAAASHAEASLTASAFAVASESAASVAAASAVAASATEVQQLAAAPASTQDSRLADAPQTFRSAIKGLLGPDDACEAADVAKVLNLQAISFASASVRVPASAVEDLRQSAQVLMACARHGKAVKLEVAGYSDNLGGARANLQLSKQRAGSVRAFLIKRGVPAGSLTAQGYGDAHPVASNDTASGRLANRRIEFIDAQPKP